MKFSLLWESMGNFCILTVFERYLSNAWRIHTKFYLCRDKLQCLPTSPLPSGVHRHLGGGEGGLRTKKWGVVSFVLRTAIISIFLSVTKCGSICRAQTCAHSGIEPSRSAKGFLQGGPKSSKKIRIFTISRLYVHISHKRLKIEAYKQHTQKCFIHPLSNCCMCMDPSAMGPYTCDRTQRGSTGWSKKWVT